MVYVPQVLLVEQPLNEVPMGVTEPEARSVRVAWYRLGITETIAVAVGYGVDTPIRLQHLRLVIARFLFKSSHD